jgi:DNA-binding NarL/FixJ family response regulator/tetratricopeptide (TPR) repeat protein
VAVAEHLVGRAAELGTFDRLLDEVDAGRPCAVALLGEPGIGKTRLLSTLTARAHERGHLVLAGSASELERDQPFAVFVDALDDYVAGLDPTLLEPLGEPVLAELGLVLPSLEREGATAVQHERYRSHRAVRALLRLLTTMRPLVLVLDDVHWCDPGSLELLGALLHRPAAAPVLTATAARPRQLPQRLAGALDRGERDGKLVRLEVDVLTREEAEELVGPTATALYEETGGNPFFLEQLRRFFDGTGQVAAGEAHTVGDVEVPHAVAAAMADELELLSEVACRVVEGAAVAGDPFEPELAAAAAGVAEAAAIGAIDELLGVDLVRRTEVPRRFRFRHPLVRRAIYDRTPGGWRLAAHERCAAELERRGASAAARAHHVELSARAGDAAAVLVLREAGEEAAPRAPGSAAHWFGAALRLLPDTVHPEARVELLGARARALAAAGRLPESRAALVEALDVAPPELQTELVVACARVEHMLGLHDPARERLERALAENADAGAAERAMVMTRLAVNRLYMLDIEGGCEWAVRALAEAEDTEPALAAEALAVRALGSSYGGLAEAQAQVDDATRVIDSLSDEQLASRLDAVAYLASAEWHRGRLDRAARHAERALAIGRATNQGDLFTDIQPVIGLALRAQGRLNEAKDALEGAVEGARLLDNAQALAWGLIPLSDVAHAAGDLELAHGAAEEAATLVEGLVGGPAMRGGAAIARARALADLGEPERAAELLLTTCGGEGLSLVPAAARPRGLELLTRSLLASGRKPAAERVVAAAADCAQFVELPLASAMAELAGAALAAAEGNHAAAARQALSAAERLEQSGRPFDATVARLTAGRALAAGPDSEAATELLEQAAAAFEGYAAERYRNEAERELRKLGRHIHRRTRPGADGAGLESLTERELEVARLVADRRTNPEIAATLFLSPKTVETHLRNIFRKVGVANRVELARAVDHAQVPR